MSYQLLEVFGIELEYMIVDKSSLAVRPLSDALIKKVTGEFVNEVANERVDWSNELVLHVIEFKNNTPEPKPLELVDAFQSEVQRANRELSTMNCRLMPGAMHPLMDPLSETRLWPHGNNEIYDSYNRIFNCQGHGWSNLQSLHINISFGNDEEFGKLHSAIRWILPFIPAISSSSPLVEGALSGSKSSRLSYYLKNQKKITSIVGLAVPDVMKSQVEYQQKILQPMYDEIAPFDTQGILQYEWLNSRGAIPKFEQGCIEIRLSDVQEAPVVDLSIADFWIKVIRKIVDGGWWDLDRMDRVPTIELRKILDATVVHGEDAVIESPEILAVFGLSRATRAQDIIRKIASELVYQPEEQIFANTIAQINERGTLSTRLTQSLNGDLSRHSILSTYQKLCDCLESGRFFVS